ncbi:MAG: MogA/MoaB family molybdenum cofactor biosynthesis protein [Desulfurococcus sp.]|nr:MogA/MoaB family molybdenum cofactor biosynthesis protein [Desulfurococcus sp.]
MILDFHVVVVSDRVARGEAVDTSGEKAVEYLSGRGYRVTGKTVVGNSYREILKAIREVKGRVLVLIGGTGPSPRDITVDVVESIAWRELPGFGEAFRRASFESIGARAIITRTGLYILHDGRVIVVLPGSPQAVETGLKILLDVINHVIEEVDRFEGPHRDR